jgi:hypothetical protein
VICAQGRDDMCARMCIGIVRKDVHRDCAQECGDRGVLCGECVGCGQGVIGAL